MAGLGGEDILKGDTHAIGPAELRQFEKRFPLAAVGIGPFGDLVGTQGAAVLDEDACADTVTENGKRLGRIDLVTACHRVHEIRRDETVHGVAEVELLCERHETVGALLDDPAASDHIEACCGDFHGVAANFGKRAKIAFKGGQFAIVRAAC